MLGMPVPAMTEVDGLLCEGDAVRWGRYEARVFHTPGHTPGSLCLYLPVASVSDRAERRTEAAQEEPTRAKLFAGDTLFAGSIGRTDLWGGSFGAIMRSIHSKLLALPDDTIVYPGHGPATTIGQERETNPFLQTR